jgi:hypothetical protein
MLVLVFVSDDGMPNGTGPIVFVRAEAGASLPANPRSLPWRYFATVTAGDAMILAEGEAATRALSEKGFYIANRLVHS